MKRFSHHESLSSAWLPSTLPWSVAGTQLEAGPRRFVGKELADGKPMDVSQFEDCAVPKIPAPASFHRLVHLVTEAGGLRKLLLCQPGLLAQDAESPGNKVSLCRTFRHCAKLARPLKIQHYRM